MAALEKAFQRHSRPQVPTLPGQNHDPSEAKRTRLLNIQSKPSWVSNPPIPQLPLAEKRRPRSVTALQAQWVDYVQLGRLLQGHCEFIICTDRSANLVMFKKSDSHHRRCFSYCHANLHTPRLVISTAEGSFLGFDYMRFTLEELCNVHVPLQEVHIRAIARHTFEALKFLNSQSLHHGGVSTHTIRICGQTGSVALSAWEESLHNEQSSLAEAAIRDLEDLGLALIQCMELPGKRQPRSAQQVRESLAQNKVFGLSEPERWSGSKQLIDFVDDLFSMRRKATSKFEKPHEYVAGEVGSPRVLLPLTELVSLECFAIWRAAC